MGSNGFITTYFFPPQLGGVDEYARLGDWARGGDCHLRRCDYQIEHQPFHSGCSTGTCDKWENGKSMSTIDTASAIIEDGA